jgi:hypothetical protein
MCGPSVWLGTVAAVVHSADGTDGQGSAKEDVESLSVFRRLPGGSLPVGKVARIRRCSRATRWISGLLSRLDVSRHPTKGEWEGTTRVEHLGFVVDTMEMKFYLAPRKVEKVQSPSDVSAATDSQRETLGRRDEALELLWPMRVT